MRLLYLCITMISLTSIPNGSKIIAHVYWVWDIIFEKLYVNIIDWREMNWLVSDDWREVIIWEAYLRKRWNYYELL